MRTYSLKAIRTNLGYTLEEASKLIGISKYTLWNYDNYIDDNDTLYDLKDINDFER